MGIHVLQINKYTANPTSAGHLVALEVMNLLFLTWRLWVLEIHQDLALMISTTAMLDVSNPSIGIVSAKDSTHKRASGLRLRPGNHQYPPAWPILYNSSH